MPTEEHDDVSNVYKKFKQEKKCQLAFDICNGLEDFAEFNYDVDSLHVIGNKSLAWLKPIINFSCSLKSIHAWPCRDKKLTNQLIHKISYEDSLKAGLNTEASKSKVPHGNKNTTWITFNLGTSGTEMLRAYALILNNQKVREINVMKYYRKNFFQNYVLKSLNKLISNANEVKSSFSHTSLINSTKEIPSNSKIRIYPDSWNEFAKEMDDLLKKGLPEYTLGIFFGYTFHGIKSEWNLMAQRIAQRIESFVNFQNIGEIALIQMHIAITLRCPGQVVIADRTKLNNVSKSSDTDIYQKFCFKKDFVYFAIKKFRNPIFSNISSTQFYPENWHILLNEKYSLRSSFFVNAALGLNGVGSLKGNIQKDYHHLPDLNKHIENIINWCRKLRSCMSSIAAGTVGRIESVFSVIDFEAEMVNADNLALNNESLLNKQFDESLQQFKNVVEYIMENGIIIKSKGCWWNEYVDLVNNWIVEPLIEKVMLRRHIDALEKPLTLTELKRIYDLEQLLLMWMDQRGNKTSIRYDSSRTKKIITMMKHMKYKNIGSKNVSLVTKGKNCACNASKFNLNNLLAEVTELMYFAAATEYIDVSNISNTTDNNSDTENPDFILAVTALESNENLKTKWFNPSSVTRRGYFPCIAKYCQFMIECAPENSFQRDKLTDHAILNLMSCYEFCIAKNWEMKTMSHESVFSLDVFERVKKARRSNKVSRLSLDDLTITSYAVAKAIKEPNTVLGKTILNRTFNIEDYHKLKLIHSDGLLEFVQEHIRVFPKFLIEPKATNYYKWHLVEDSPIIRGSKLEFRCGNIKTDCYRQDKLDRYYTKLDYRRNLKNFKSFKR